MRIARNFQFSSQGKRPIQEDFYLQDANNRFFVVADGFGDGNLGKQASQRCCESVMEFLTRVASDEDATMPFGLRSYLPLEQSMLSNAVLHANRMIRKSSLSCAACCAAGFFQEDVFYLSNTGSTSIYLIRQNKLMSLFMPQTIGFFQQAKRSDGFLQELPLISVGLALDLDPLTIACKVFQDDQFIFTTKGFKESHIQKMANPKSFDQLSGQMKGWDFEENATACLLMVE